MFNKLWVRTKEVATMYTGTFVVVMILNQLLFFGFCLNPICLIAAMPHVLFITVIVGTWLNKKNGWGRDQVDGKAVNRTAKTVSSTITEVNKLLVELGDESTKKTESEYKKTNFTSIQPKLIDKSTSENKRNAVITFNDFNNKHLPSSKATAPKIDITTPWVDEIPPWVDDMPPWLGDMSNHDTLWIDEKNFFIEKLKLYGISSVWHMTHKENIQGILNQGILSNYLAHETENPPVDISDHGAQRWREAKDPIYKRRIHEYAPTYFNVRNPMLYVRRNIQNDLCLIEISLTSLLNSDFIFTDGNAASRNTAFFNSANDLELLPWEVLRAPYWSDFTDGKRKKCAELLIYPPIQPKHIVKIHCNSTETLRYIQKLGYSAKISHELFFTQNKTNRTCGNFNNDDIPF